MMLLILTVYLVTETIRASPGKFGRQRLQPNSRAPWIYVWAGRRPV
jgi:hypothetical protein